jgi:predicted aspartyl protease
MKTISSSIIFILLITSINLHAEWLPFTLKNNHITIDIEFNGQPARAILDSGAESNAVSAFYVERYNDGIYTSGNVNVVGVNGTQKRSQYSNVPVKLFGAEFTLNKLVAFNLGGSAILLGAPFFKNLIVQIDYPNSRIQLLPKKSIDMNKFKNVNIKRQRGTLLPAIEVKINNKNVWLTLDTGNNGGLFMKRSYALENNWLSTNTELRESRARGVNGIAMTETFDLPSLLIGPYELENIPVTIPTKGEASNVGRRAREYGSFNKGKQTRGLLGYDILKHFVITIDYSNYKVHIVAP